VSFEQQRTFYYFLREIKDGGVGRNPEFGGFQAADL
jgi:hypothetical protein